MHKKLVKKGQWGMEISSPLGTLHPEMSPFRKPQYEQVNSWFQTDKIVPQQHLYSMPNNYEDKLPDVNELSNFLVSNTLGNNTDISNTGTPTIRSSSITPTFDPTLLQKFSASTFGRNFNQWNSGLNMASNAVTTLFGNKSEYDGDKGYVTQGLDGAYDTVQNFASTLGPAGQLVSLGMGVNKLVGNIANKLGAGTDGITTIDAALGSSFLAPIGIINGALGKRADTITKDNQAFQQVGSSYGGTMTTVDDALEKSGKKYGVFSSGSRHAANRQINEAKQQQSIMSDIADFAYDRFAIQGSTAAINENRRNYYMTGGYDYDSVHFGRNGMSMELMKKAKEINAKINNKQNDVPQHKNGGTFIELTHLPTEICLVNPIDVPEFQEGGRISKKIRDYYKDYNLDEITVINDSSPRTENDTIYSPSDEFTVHELWHYISQNKPNEALKEFYDSLNDNKLLQFGADLDFVKRTGDPSDFYNPSELEARLKAAKFMSQGQNYTKDFFKNLRSNENQYGDNMRDLLRMFNDDYLEKLFNINSAQKFQEGGSINVIPDGALHARKHNMDMDGITKKGIPVVSEGENGHIEQQAEIEKEEIIFRLEVTKQLEEMERKYYNNDTSNKEKDELALKAGQLLVKEILYNTQDNTQALL